jgi:protein TonB
VLDVPARPLEETGPRRDHGARMPVLRATALVVPLRPRRDAHATITAAAVAAQRDDISARRSEPIRLGWVAAAALHAALIALVLATWTPRPLETAPLALMAELVYAAPEAPAVEVASAPLADEPPAAVAETPPVAAEPEPSPPIATAVPEPDPLPPEVPQAASPPETVVAIASPPLPPDPPKPRPKPSRPVAQPAPAPTSPAAAPPSVSGSSTPPREIIDAPPVQTALVPPPLAAALIPPRPVSGLAGNRRPDYPPEARRRNLQGDVMLRVAVSASGTPEAVAVLTSSGHAALDNAATAAIRTWRFEPATSNGTPVPAPADVPVRFRLQD